MLAKLSILCYSILLLSFLLSHCLVLKDACKTSGTEKYRKENLNSVDSISTLISPLF